MLSALIQCFQGFFKKQDVQIRSIIKCLKRRFIQGYLIRWYFFVSNVRRIPDNNINLSVLGNQIILREEILLGIDYIGIITGDFAYTEINLSVVDVNRTNIPMKSLIEIESMPLG